MLAGGTTEAVVSLDPLFSRGAGALILSLGARARGATVVSGPIWTN